ncbi:sugar-binding transcriptional regulator [Falsibacillus albus]|uniref:Sugar-binding transcriptional regulator n=1 Tax=Falsibacillus albus TaxID=2478915 RepID=A0A3L7JXM9_9BACI|nr:sugar-binding transcriptional regulator [Falsibacillus albus]RLQ94879.1 sugar-binding transcriptional regulator [Falsibacillus albus]
MELTSKDIFTQNLLIKVAWYYYKDNLTQTEISDLLHLSRNKVVRLLDRARAENIVQFHIKGDGVNCLEIEHTLMDAFAISNAFVIPTPKHDLSRSLAKAAAQYMENTIANHELIGFGWGEAVSRTIESLTIDPSITVSMVTLTGGVNYYFQKRDHSLEGGLDKFKGGIHVIPAPFLASTKEMAANMLSEPSVKDILDLASLSHHVVVGIGGLSKTSTIIKEEKMTLNELVYIKNQNAVGDILGQFFDADGEPLDLPHHERLIGTNISTLKDLNNVIGVAGGPKKIDAIYGALKGGYLNTIITDEETAKALIKKLD